MQSATQPDANTKPMSEGSQWVRDFDAKYAFLDKNEEAQKVFKTAKLSATTVCNIGLATLAGLSFENGAGAFAYVTALLWCATVPARDSSLYANGNTFEAAVAINNFTTAEYSKTKTAFKGIGAAAKQCVPIRLASYAAITSAALIDSVGYACKAVATGIVAGTKDADERIANIWHDGSKTFVCANTMRDILWRGGFIAPTETASNTIMRNSALKPKQQMAVFASYEYIL